MSEYTISNNSQKLADLRKALFKFDSSTATDGEIAEYNRSELSDKWEFKRLYCPKSFNITQDSYIIPVAQGTSVTGFLFKRTRKHADDAQALIVYFHSGGWMLGNTDTTCAVCSNICNETGAIVLAVDYRLAPKYKFPTAIEDCYQAFLWAYSGAKYWKINTSRVYVMGSSCGANIATSVCQMARDKKGPVPAGQILIDPVTDCRLRTQSIVKYKDNPILKEKQLVRYIEAYQREPKDILDPLFSPLLSKDLSRLPDALILSAEYDILHDDAVLYAEALKNADSQAKIITREASLHGFMDFPASERWKDYMYCISEFVKGISVNSIVLTNSFQRFKRARNKILFFG